MSHFLNECDKLDKKCGWTQKLAKKLKKFKGLCPTIYILEIQKINNISRVFKHSKSDSISSSCDSLDSSKTPSQRPNPQVLNSQNINKNIDSTEIQNHQNLSSSDFFLQRKHSAGNQNLIPVFH